ncbi:MAG TPA: ATP-binding protein [Candidatus Limnocylindrales bacterium]|jgi:PAS domain S-box-containing protein
MALESHAARIGPSPDAGVLDDPGGPLLQLLSGVRGLADRGATDSPAARQGERYREFLEALGVAVYTTDARGKITFFNRAAVELWGRTPELGEEWCGSWKIYDLDGERMPHAECPMAIALKENREVRGAQAVAERPDGSRIAFVPYPTPLRNDRGELIGAVNVLVDVSERAEAERALRQAAQALEASNAVKDEFLGLVSHELRTPVTTIFGNARLLRDRGERLSDDARQAMIADIAHDSERLLGIIENMLLLTRLESGPQPDLEPNILAHVVREAIDSFERRHPGRKVALVAEPRHVIVEADRTYIELLLENLLGNADKYSPAGSAIDVRIEVHDGEAHVAVLDRGIGLSDVEPAQIFAPFYRGAEAKRQASGIGIGLAVCRRVAEAQGGRIWARSRAGGGSEFGFALPLVDPAEVS